MEPFEPVQINIYRNIPFFLEAVLAIENVRVKSDLQEKDKFSILKDDFFSRTDPSIFISTATVTLDLSNETGWLFLALKPTSHFLLQSPVSCNQIQVQKQILAVATYQMPDQT